MEAILNFNIPLTFQQVADAVRQLPKSEQLQLVRLLRKEAKQKESIQTHFASQEVLAQDWLNLEEDQAWQHL